MQKKEKCLSFILTAAVIAVDQASKMWIASSIPLNAIGRSFFGDFLRIIHVRNLGIAFSIGYGFPDAMRAVLFRFVPVATLAAIVVYYLRTGGWTRLQGWSLAGIIGGGIGNIIDRFARPGGVVDFIDIKFYGIFGLERWPTFNIADATVVVCGVLMLISLCLPQFSHKSKN